MSSAATEPETEARRDFLDLFQRRRAAVERVRWFRSTLFGFGLGVGLAALGAAALYWLGWHEYRFHAVGLVGAGIVGGLVHAFRSRFSDEDVALYLDARLHAKNRVSTAIAPEGNSQLLALVYREAARALRTDGAVTPKWWARRHWSVPVAAAALVAVLSLPPRKVPAEPAAPGAEALTVHELEGLEAVQALEELEALDPEQREKLHALAVQAQALAEELKQGTERREALSKLAKLRDAVESQLGELSNQKNRPGLARAIEALRRNPSTRQAARALGEGDLIRFDEEMRRIAENAEEESREAAKEALKEAQQAAKDSHSKALSSALSEQQRLFEQREHVAELLRQLADIHKGGDPSGTPSNGGRQPLEGETQQQLSDSLEKALKGLTEDERKRLGERLRQALKDGQLDLDPGSEDELRRLSQKLADGQGQQELTEMLRQLAQPSDGSQTMQGLRRAEEGLRRAQRELGGVLPVPQAGPGLSPNGQPGSSPPGVPDVGGPGRGPGSSEHEGSTGRVEAEELRAKADPRLNPSLPLLQANQGRTASRPGEQARVPSLGSLRSAGAEQVQGVEHSTIPEEYREQVSRYFSD